MPHPDDRPAPPPADGDAAWSGDARPGDGVRPGDARPGDGVRPGDAFRHESQGVGDPVRTFHPRRAPLGERRTGALERLWPRFGVSVHDPALGLPPTGPDGTLDAVRLFGRSAPLVLEIGSGMGDATAAMAAADPGRDYLAVEAHLPGIANLLVLLDERGLSNVRVAHGDALDLVRRTVAEGSLDAVHVFFPDPWPKARHHKRRIIAPDHVALLRSRLRVGGTLHCATDWAEYAEQMLEVVAADPGLTNPHGGFAPRPDHRPVTKFERRGLDAGRASHDVVATRTR
ncbi:tRNA (guanosine(46)-N7)-methyltransferase TrmB [Cellulomonas pakistanensis]|uniref:tRNA (guanine-N(7)-)-methyltransferase n=1 Tax=Cellulomonas pakistanensis TaxID=992287 RepID=A0A919P9Q5_9CELL|nr:tRNA (guanosine(46)-N7)-methyltransferase TrmB [Cellulomonas pakistanensis]GIG37004.1 tRNA (guanine-N(7)-)-methyltransferase [Cellulomonas pakistanensis]